MTRCDALSPRPPHVQPGRCPARDSAFADERHTIVVKKEGSMIFAFTVGGGLVVMGVAAFLFSRQGGPTRSVAHVLYEAEQTPPKAR